MALNDPGATVRRRRRVNPILMGVEFYCKGVAYQERYRKSGMTFENTMQINGTLLNDEFL